MVNSYNGWSAGRTAAEVGGLDNRPIPGTKVTIPPGLRAGDVATVLFYVAGQLHKRVEPAAAPGCWGFYYKQSANSAALLSCHSSGTAFDFNAPRHPNGRRGTFTPAQVAEIRKILAEVGGVVYWGGDAWGDGTPDEMHFEIKTGVTAAQVKTVAARLTSTSTLTALKAEEPDMTPEQAKQLAEVHLKTVAQVLPLAGRPGADQDDPLGHLLSADAAARQALAKVTALEEKVNQILSLLKK